MKVKISISLVIWISVIGALTSAHAGNTVYKSVGPDGSIVYSDHPPADGRVEKTFEFADLPSTPVPDSQPSPSAAKRNDPKPPNVVLGGTTLFSATWCGYCKRAKVYLQQNGISYRNIDIDTAEGRSQFKSAGGGGVPLLFNGNRSIRGFSAEGYARFFRSR